MAIYREEIVESLNRRLYRDMDSQHQDLQHQGSQAWPSLEPRNDPRASARLNASCLPQDRASGAASAEGLIDLADEAYLSECQGCYEEAERLYQKSIGLRQQQYGQQHPAVANVLSDLAALYCSQNRYAEAQPLLEQALAIQTKSSLGEPEMGEVLYRLATIHYYQERYSKADPLFQHALAIFRQQFGADDPRTQAVYSDLMQMVVMAIETGRFSELSTELRPLEPDEAAGGFWE